MSQDFLSVLSLRLPIFQAPMAGVSTPALAAAVSEAGGLGALGLGASTPQAAAKAIAETRALTARAFNVNLFCHAPARRDPAQEQAWIARNHPMFARFDAEPPAHLQEIYRSFLDDDAMLQVLLESRPKVISFHFGLPDPDRIAALRDTGALLVASATSVDEARQIAGAGLDAVVAQGWEAGGHRGIFDPEATDAQLSTEVLTRQIARDLALPIISAGGLMQGADVARALDWGAVAAQLGTAFVACPESAADAAYRQRIAEGGDTVMTAAISGRPARCLHNDFTDWTADVPGNQLPAYPCAYDLGKALNAAAKAKGQTGFGAQWAGMNVAGSRALPAADLMATLEQEFHAAREDAWNI
nr:nitronate monooxygenase [uncultured Celeribacter sp.]